MSAMIRRQRAKLGLLALTATSCTFPNEDHCWVTHGDATCRSLFVSGYCSSDRSGCEGHGVPFGCVPERPVDDACYSPRGQNRSCMEQFPAPECTGCGDGVVNGSEACDDGNRIDEDDCTNACTVAVCGDGIVSPINAETCDDTNTQDGDLCSSNCRTAGSPTWEVYQDFDGTVDAGYVVEIDGEGRIDVLAGVDGSLHLLQYGSTGALDWTTPACTTAGTSERPNLSLGPDGRIVLGCASEAAIGQIRRFAVGGGLELSSSVPYMNSDVLAAVVNTDGDIVAAGVAGGSALLTRFDAADGDVLWDRFGAAGRHGPIALGLDGQLRVWHDDAASVRSYDLAGNLRWESAAFDGPVNCRAMAIDEHNSLYVLLQVGSFGFDLRKLDHDGTQIWEHVHDAPNITEGADGLALRPNGGVIVAGYSYEVGKLRGRLTWFDPDGELVLDDVIEEADDVEGARLFDVAVSDRGEAVAVGLRVVRFEDSDLWVRKFAL